MAACSTASQEPCLLRVERLSKYYGANAAVRELSFELARGEVLGLLGLNGAGKTTILRILAADLSPTSGRVLLHGQELDPMDPALRGRVGYLPEISPIYPEMSARSYLRYLARLRGVARAELSEQTEQALDRFGLLDVAQAPAGTLSFGFRKRLGLAQASVHGPELLLLDEPVAGLDPVQIAQVRQKIREMAREHAVIISSHILSEIHQTCDRILVLVQGKLVAQGSEEELRSSSRASSLRVELRCTPERASELLRALQGLREIRVVGDSRGRVELELSCEVDLREELARRVVAAGVGLLGMQAAQGELEDLFLELTGQGAVREVEP